MMAVSDERSNDLESTIACPKCGKTNSAQEFLCYGCGEFLSSTSPGDATRSLVSTGDLPGFSDDYYDENSRLYLRVRGANKAFELLPQNSPRALVVGRNRRDSALVADVDLSDYNGEQLGVSRHHLAIRYEGETHTVNVSDLGSVNGTFVNGQKLHKGEVRALCHGDQIRLGKLVLGATILHEFSGLEDL
jgi:tRNA(Ile2) C34 agmatinyltransferase TiaS